MLHNTIFQLAPTVARATATVATASAVATAIATTIPLPTLVHGSLMRRQRRLNHQLRSTWRGRSMATATMSKMTTASTKTMTTRLTSSTLTPMTATMTMRGRRLLSTAADTTYNNYDGKTKNTGKQVTITGRSTKGGNRGKAAAAATAFVTQAAGDGDGDGDGDFGDEIDVDVDNVDASSLLQTLVQVQELVAASSAQGSGSGDDDKFTMPKIVSIGNQSAGKSSVCAALLGIDLFPTGSNMVTRRPLELTLLRAKRGEAVYGQFGAFGDKIYDIAELTRRIASANAEVAEDEAGGGVSTDPIRLTISSPTVLPMVLVDVPGYIAVTKHGQREDLPEQIEKMCDAYVRDSNYIKLVVMSATVDRANSLALAKLKRAGQMHNAFGVLTKLDLVTNGSGGSGGDDVVFGSNNGKVTDMLTDADYAPGLGLVGVVMRTSQEQDGGVTIAQSIHAEQRHFVRHGLIVEADVAEAVADGGDVTGITTLPTTTHTQLLNGNGVVEGVKLGVPFLQQALSREHLRKTAASIPSLVKQLDVVIARAKSNSSLLSQLAKQPDLDVISRELGKILDDMSAWSPRRRAFELQLNTALQSFIRDTVHESLSVVSGPKSSRKIEGKRLVSLPASTTQSSLMPADERSNMNVRSAPIGNGVGGAGHIDLNAVRCVIRPARNHVNNQSTSYTSYHRDHAADRDYDQFVVYGKCSSQAHQHELDAVQARAFTNVDGVGMMPFVRQTVSSDTASMKVAWNEQLERVIEHVLRRQHIATHARQLCIDEILSYVNKAAARKAGDGGSDSDMKLVHHFFGYLVEKISERTNSDQLIFSIEQALLREKRPVTSFAGMSAALVRQQCMSSANGYPSEEQENMLAHSYFTESYPRPVAMFSDAWSEAYYDVMIRRVELDVFRMMAVNLLDPLIHHCLNLSLTFFQGLNVSTEEQLMMQRVNELRALRAQLLVYKQMQL